MEPISSPAFLSADLDVLSQRQMEVAKESMIAEEQLKNTHFEIEKIVASSNSLKNQVTQFNERQKIYLTAIAVSSVFAGVCIAISYYR